MIGEIITHIVANFFKRMLTAMTSFPDAFDSMPRDSESTVILLDDLVSWRGSVWQVVAMSHRHKVCIRVIGEIKGGRWVSSANCTFVRHSNRKGN